MARYEHLELLRLPERFERRKTGRGMGPPDRDIAAHGTRLREALDNVVAAQRRRRRPEFVDPSLILRVRMSGMLLEQDWEQLGLTVLSSDQDRTLVLFASDDELRDFRHRLEAWRGGRQPDRRAPPHNNFIAGIEDIGEVEPADRIGLRFREDGFATPDDFDDHEIYLADLELWDLGVRRLRERKLDEVIDYIDARGGETYERYIGPSITMIRARLSGALIKTLLAIDEISSIDAPPEADISTAEAFELGLDDLPEPAPIDDDAPLIGVIDSGVNDHPLLADAIAGAIGTPEHLGSADDFGHGTRVAGVAALWRLDRLGRSMRQLIDTVEEIQKQGAHLKSVNEAIDTSTATGRMLLHVLGALAKFERSRDGERGALERMTPPRASGIRMLSVRLIAAAVLFSAGPLALSAPAVAEEPKVRTTKPESGGAQEKFRLPVIAEPQKQARLYARANGFVAERKVDIGDAVKAGDVLATIDAPEIVRNQERAKAAVGQADARVALADANLKRTAALAGKDYASEASLDDRRAQANVAIADREAALAELRRFDELLAFRQVRAPFDGVVTARNIEIGDLVVGDQASSATPMFELARIVELRIVADVPQGAIASIRQGEDVRVTFDRFDDEVFSARVSRMSQSIDRRSGTMRVELAMDNPGGRVPAGLAGHAEFVRSNDGALRVPTSALTIRDGKPVVVTLRDGAIEFRDVELGRDLGRMVEVRKGLAPSDEVVLNPNSLLRPGDRARKEQS